MRMVGDRAGFGSRWVGLRSIRWRNIAISLIDRIASERAEFFTNRSTTDMKLSEDLVHLIPHMLAA